MLEINVLSVEIYALYYLYLEPGYYEAEQFGIRLENIVMVTEAETKVRLCNTNIYLSIEVFYYENQLSK